MPTAEEYLSQWRGEPLPLSSTQHVTPELWVQPISEDSDVAHTTTLLIRFAISYTNSPEVDEDLFFQYKEDFEEWTNGLFKLADGEARKLIKRILRKRGIYLPRLGSTFLHLANLLQMDEMPAWPTNDPNP